MPIGLARITSLYPNFNGSHFGLPPRSIHRYRLTGLPPKMVWTMTYSHKPHALFVFNCLQLWNLLFFLSTFQIVKRRRKESTKLSAFALRSDVDTPPWHGIITPGSTPGGKTSMFTSSLIQRTFQSFRHQKLCHESSLLFCFAFSNFRWSSTAREHHWRILC